MSRKSLMLILAGVISCGDSGRGGGAAGDGDSCDPSTQGYVDCGQGINTCQPGQYCEDQTFATCSTGCLADVNCACNQVCEVAAGNTVGTCSNKQVNNSPRCGDGSCNGGENSMSCPSDCGMQQTGPVCGNRACETGENNANCSADCAPQAVCGNQVCEFGESEANCAGDCGPNPAACRDICSSYDFFSCFQPGELQSCFDRCGRASSAQLEQFENCGGTGAVSCTECRQFLPQ